jgi:hypothetical protein
MALDHDVPDAVLRKSDRGRQPDWSGTNDYDVRLKHVSLPYFREAHRFGVYVPLRGS